MGNGNESESDAADRATSIISAVKTAVLNPKFGSSLQDWMNLIRTRDPTPIGVMIGEEPAIPHAIMVALSLTPTLFVRWWVLCKCLGLSESTLKMIKQR